MPTAFSSLKLSCLRTLATQVAEELELKKGSYTILECEMSSLKSVSDFCNK